MKTKAKPIIAILSVFLVAICVLSIVLVKQIQKNKPEVVVQQVYDLLPAMTEETLMEGSTLVLTGTLEDVSEAFTVETYSGATMLFSDYYIKPNKVLRGSIEEGETVVVRMEGGLKDNRLVVLENAPTLQKGKEYLMFLYQPNIGGSYNTEGDYYYIRGGFQGVFFKSSSENRLKKELPDIAQDDSIYIVSRYENDSDFRGVLTREGVEGLSSFNISPNYFALNQLSDELNEYNKVHPVDKDARKNDAIKGLKGNLDSGFISQEEYDEAIEDMEHYAVIVP